MHWMLVVLLELCAESLGFVVKRLHIHRRPAFEDIVVPVGLKADDDHAWVVVIRRILWIEVPRDFEDLPALATCRLVSFPILPLRPFDVDIVLIGEFPSSH